MRKPMAFASLAYVQEEHTIARAKWIVALPWPVGLLLFCSVVLLGNEEKR